MTNSRGLVIFGLTDQHVRTMNPSYEAQFDRLGEGFKDVRQLRRGPEPYLRSFRSLP